MTAHRLAAMVDEDAEAMCALPSTWAFLRSMFTGRVAK